MRLSMNSSRFSLRIPRLPSATGPDATFPTADFLSAGSAFVWFRALSTWSPILTRIRSWSFLALREITDEILPADAVAWRGWYKDKGAAKRAQFAALDWWQVRGD